MMTGRQDRIIQHRHFSDTSREVGRELERDGRSGRVAAARLHAECPRQEHDYDRRARCLSKPDAT